MRIAHDYLENFRVEVLSYIQKVYNRNMEKLLHSTFNVNVNYSFPSVSNSLIQNIHNCFEKKFVDLQIVAVFDNEI